MNYPRYVEVDLTAKTVKVSTWKGSLTEGGQPIWTVNSDLKGGPGRELGEMGHLDSVVVSISKDGEEVGLFESDSQ